MIHHIGNDRSYENLAHPETLAVYAGFQGMSDLIDHVESIVPKNEYADRYAGWKPETSNSWYGTKDMETAINLARNGWDDGVAKAREILATIPSPIGRSGRTHRVAGGSVNVGRMLAGNPCHMRSRTNAPSDKIITLYNNCTTRFSITTNSLIRRATVVAAMIDQLESSGYRCEIISFMYTRDTDTNRDVLISVKLKDSGECLNLSEIMFGLGHPSMQRRLMFAVLGGQPVVKGRIYRTMGCIVKPVAQDYILPELKNSHITLSEISANLVPQGLPVTFSI